MACESCERTIEAALTRLEGVRDVDADHEAARVRVTFDSGHTDEQRLRAAIGRAGFDATPEGRVA
jgi:copper chaperone CopZ